MSGKFDKFKDIFNMVEPLAKPFVPGGVGSVLDKVSSGLNGASPASADAIKTLAAHVDEYNDQQDRAILALLDRIKALEAKQG